MILEQNCKICHFCEQKTSSMADYKLTLGQVLQIYTQLSLSFVFWVPFFLSNLYNLHRYLNSLGVSKVDLEDVELHIFFFLAFLSIISFPFGESLSLSLPLSKVIIQLSYHLLSFF